MNLQLKVVSEENFFDVINLNLTKYKKNTFKSMKEGLVQMHSFLV